MFILNSLITKINDGLYKEILPSVDINEFLPFTKKYKTINLLRIAEIALEYNPELYREIMDCKTLLETPRSTLLISNKGRDSKYITKFLSLIIFSHLNIQSKVTKEVMEILISIDKEACVVGGFVRDAILGKEPKDLDFVSSVDYETLLEVFKSNNFIVKECGKKFLVFSVTKNGETFEIANFRKDGTYVDGRRPEGVGIGSIYEDSQRRDFTVNALYFELSSESLLDPTGQGIIDISNKCLRFVGNPKERLNEDALRGLRFYRFLKKGFTPEPKSLREVRTNFSEILMKSDPERVRMEIERMASLV